MNWDSFGTKTTLRISYIENRHPWDMWIISHFCKIMNIIGKSIIIVQYQNIGFSHARTGITVSPNRYYRFQYYRYPNPNFAWDHSKVSKLLIKFFKYLSETFWIALVIPLGCYQDDLHFLFKLSYIRVEALQRSYMASELVMRTCIQCLGIAWILLSNSLNCFQKDVF